MLVLISVEINNGLNFGRIYLKLEKIDNKIDDEERLTNRNNNEEMIDDLRGSWSNFQRKEWRKK